MKNLIILFLLISAHNYLFSQAKSWQFIHSLGTDKEYPEGGGGHRSYKFINKAVDKDNNIYLAYALSGDTVCYNGKSYKKPIVGGRAAFVLYKIRCDGSLVWTRNISDDFPGTYQNTVFGIGDDCKMCFGKDDNTIIMSWSLAYDNPTYYIEPDTVIHKINDTNYRINNSNAVIYDSLGNVKRLVNKSGDTGFCMIDGCFKGSNRYFTRIYFDTINTIPKFRNKYQGQYIAGQYFALLDSNFNYIYLNKLAENIHPFKDTISPIAVLLTDGNTRFIGNTDNRVFYFHGGELYNDNDNDTSVKNYYERTNFIIKQDTLRCSDSLDDMSYNALIAFDNNGNYEFSKFGHNYTRRLRYKDKKSTDVISVPHVHLGSDTNIYFSSMRIEGHNVWDGDTMKLPFKNMYSNGGIDTLGFLYGSMNKDGKLVWHRHIPFFDNNSGTNFSTSLNKQNDIILSADLRGSCGNFDCTVIRSQKLIINGTKYLNETIKVVNGEGNSKPLIARLKRNSDELLYIGDDRRRRTDYWACFLNKNDDIYQVGEKMIPGSTYDEDSTPITLGYNPYGGELFIAKYGTSICKCDSIQSEFIPIDTTKIGKLTVKYTGTMSDSVLYIWGDGTQTFVKPSTASFTKSYYKDTSFTVRCISYNSCFETSTSSRTFKIVCDTPRSEYKTFDTTKLGEISLVYNGSNSDSVIYLWGDGTQTVAKPSTAVVNKVYLMDTFISIACVSFSQCGKSDTFKQVHHIKCGSILNKYSIVSHVLKTISIQYTGSAIDTVRYLWGDGTDMLAFAPSTKLVTHTYGASIDSAKVSSIVRNQCGKYDTFSQWFVFCKPTLSNQAKIFCDSNYKISISADTNFVFQNWSDGTMTNPKIISTTQSITGIYLKKNGCSHRDSFDLRKYISPTMQKATKYLDCAKTPIELNALSPNTINYKWNTSAITSAINVNTKGVYSVILTHTCGLFRDTFTVLDTNKSVIDTIKKVECGSYKWRDSIYTKSGKYTRIIKNVIGCDSMITLDLSIGLEAKLMVINGSNLTVKDTFKSYQWYICNPWKKISNETKRTLSTISKTSYAVVVSNGVCIDTSDCMALNSSQIQLLGLDGMSIYPNPTKDKLNIEMNKIYQETKIRIYDMLGKLTHSADYKHTDKIILDVERFANGIYTMYIEHDKQIENIKFIKE